MVYVKRKDWPRGYNFFFMLNSVEHEILDAHKYKNILYIKIQHFSGLDKHQMLFFPAHKC